MSKPRGQRLPRHLSVVTNSRLPVVSTGSRFVNAGVRLGMFFKNQRKIATAAAIERTRPFIGIIQNNAGIPSWFWNDPFVLGFLGYMIGHFARLATRGKITGEELGYVLADTFTNLSNINGVVLAQQYSDYSLSKERDQGFVQGGDNAALICGYEMGILKNEEENQHVIEAKKVADAASGEFMFSGSSERERVFSVLLNKLFFEMVDKRRKQYS